MDDAALKEKNGCPGGRSPSVLFSCVPVRPAARAGFTRLAMKPASNERKHIMSTNEETKKSPVRKIRAGSVTASIWENVKDGKTRTSVTVQRSYKNGDGQWKNSDSYGGAELLELAKVALAAYDELHLVGNAAE
jgi:hypothetical protein